MRIMITGAGGQLGKEISILLSKNQEYEIFPMNRTDMDITNKESVFSLVESIQPDVIVHCAAYTAVDKAEIEQNQCYLVNVEGTKNVVDASIKANAKFIYFSTDYVFSGNKKDLYLEDDPTMPLNYYGKSKLLGENISKTNSKHFIIRVSWLYGQYGNNFVNTIRRLLNEKKELQVVSDQFGSPTYTYDIAEMVQKFLKYDEYGTYHFSNSGDCSWYDFALEISNQLNSKTKIIPILSKDFPTKAKRPFNSRLSKEKILKTKLISLQPWKESLNAYLIDNYYKN